MAAGLTDVVTPSERAELQRMSMHAWRNSLGGVALMAAAVAAAFIAFAPARNLWVWGCICLAVYGAQALLLLSIERRFGERHVPASLSRISLLFGALSGGLWGSLPWLVPADPPSLPLMAALACAFALLGAARSPGTLALLRSIALPGVVLVPSGLLWHAHSPLAGAVSLVVMLMIVRHGRSVRNELLRDIRQRRRVDALSAEVLQQQERLQAAAREQGIANERQRLLRDMHDGVGASLVSALRLIEQGELTLDEAARVLRECLDDLRIVIDSLEPIEHDLVTLLATLRYRLGGRLERAGIVIDWVMGEIPPLPWLNAPQALEVLRIVQEALANVVKHSGASRVRVALQMGAAAETGECVVLTIDDNGGGFDSATVTPGRGLDNMRHRAGHLGVTLYIGPAVPQGTRLQLCLPLDRQLGGLAAPPTALTPAGAQSRASRPSSPQSPARPLRA